MSFKAGRHTKNFTLPEMKKRLVKNKIEAFLWGRLIYHKIKNCVGLRQQSKSKLQFGICAEK